MLRERIIYAYTNSRLKRRFDPAGLGFELIFIFEKVVERLSEKLILTPRL